MSIPYEIIDKATQKILSKGILFENDPELLGYMTSPINRKKYLMNYKIQ